MRGKNVNRFVLQKKRRRGFINILGTIGVFVALIVLFNHGINNLTQANEEEALEAVRIAVTRAAIQFYALEGRFPPHLEYLEERFGLQLDHERFEIVYSAFGANVMPQILVTPRDW